MEQAKQNNQKHNRKPIRPNRRAVFLIAAAALAVYLVIVVISAFSNVRETEPAVHVSVNDSFMSTGWFFRDEQTVSGSASGSVKHVVYSGERVQQDAALALVYADEQSLALSREIEPLENRIRLLDSALETVGNTSDSANVDQMITLTIQQMADQAKTGQGNGMSSSADTLRTLSLQSVSSSVDTLDIQSERDALEAERAALEQQLSGQTTELTAPISGYYSEVVDGYENVLTRAALENLTLGEFRTLTQSPEKIDAGQVLGKMIQGFTWYLAAEIPTEQADRLSEGQDLRVNFTQASLETPVSVYSIIREHGSDTALLVLEGTEFNSEMVSMREQPVEIILATYSGLKVPKSAVRIEESTNSDGTTTQRTVVYILSGGVEKSKIINPLYEAEDYYVVEQSATNWDMLVENDQIVVRGRNLQNNMVVR